MTIPPPRVSVVIPCYNQAHFLPEAVASVVGQTFRDWEIIIVDDGSPDDTAAVAGRLIVRYPEHTIRLLRQANQGLGASRNTGIRAARGDYILPLDADDALEPEMLAATVAVLDAHPEVGFVYTDVHIFGAETTTWSGGGYSLARLRFDCFLNPATLFRKQAWAMAGGYQQSMHPQGYEDWDFWLSLAEAGWQGWHVARPLVRYRRTAGSMLSRVCRYDLELRAQIIINHPRLYEPAFVAWAQRVRSPVYLENGALRSPWRWLWAFASYTALVARTFPPLLPKILLRPVVCRLPIRQQSYARELARLLHVSQRG
jgi:glycosyltransferase involved in cell wall biosynthesis